MAVVSTSLTKSYPPQFSGLRRTSFDHSQSLSTTQSFFNHIDSHLRLSSSSSTSHSKASRAVVSMAGSGKVHTFFLLIPPTRFLDLTSTRTMSILNYLNFYKFVSMLCKLYNSKLKLPFLLDFRYGFVADFTFSYVLGGLGEGCMSR